MQTPLILLGPTVAGGSIIPVVGSAAGDLRGLTLLGINSPELVVETSLDAITWTVAGFPLTLVGGFLRVTRLSDSPLASVISAVAPDPAPVTPDGLLPAGGAAGQILAKSATGDFQAEWIAPPAGGGGAGSGATIFLQGGVPEMVYTQGGSNKYYSDIAKVVVRRQPTGGYMLPGGIYNFLTTPFPALDINAATLLILDSDGNQFANFSNLGVTQLAAQTVGSVVQVSFPPVYIPPGCSFEFYPGEPIQMMVRNGSVGETERISLYNDNDQLIAGVLGLGLGGPKGDVFDGPSGNYMMPYTTGPRASNTGTDGLLPGHTSLVVPPDGSKPFFQVFGDNFSGFQIVGARSGPSASRPGYGFVATGDQYFDTTLHKPLWYDAGWRDATGTLV